MREDVRLDTARALDVEDDLAARHPLEHVAREECQQLIAPEERPSFVDDAEAIGVAVVADPEVGLLRQDPRGQIDHVLRHRRIGLMIGEASVRLAVERNDGMPELLQDRNRHRTGHAVAGIGHDLERPRRTTAFHHHRLVGIADRAARLRPLAVGEVVRVDSTEQILNARAVNRVGAELKFESVVLDRIVRAGDHGATVGLVVDDREVERRGRHHADPNDVAAGRAQSLRQPGHEARRGLAHILTHRHRASAGRAEGRSKGLAKTLRQLIGQVGLGDAADVVFAENIRIDHVVPFRGRRR